MAPGGVGRKLRASCSWHAGPAVYSQRQNRNSEVLGRCATQRIAAPAGSSTFRGYSLRWHDRYMADALLILAALRAAAEAGDAKAAAFLPMFIDWALSSLPASGRC